MKRLAFTLMLLCFAFAASATPTWMWISTFAIEDYPGTANDLTYCIDEANAFYTYAAANTTLASRYQNVTNSGVTVAAISNNSTREMSDFLFYSGHGTNNALYTYNGVVSAAALAIGTNYTRWAIMNSCIFFSGNDLFTALNPAFRGVQVILGFRSLSYDHGLYNQEFSDFWRYWVTSAYSIWMAYRTTQYDNGYRLIGAAGLAPAYGSASTTYQNQTFQQATSTRATNNAAQFGWATFGTPSY